MEINKEEVNNLDNNGINNTNSKKELEIEENDETQSKENNIYKKVDRSRSEKKKTQTNNRKNDRKNKMTRNECGYGEEV